MTQRLWTMSFANRPGGLVLLELKRWAPTWEVAQADARRLAVEMGRHYVSTEAAPRCRDCDCQTCYSDWETFEGIPLCHDCMERRSDERRARGCRDTHERIR